MAGTDLFDTLGQRLNLDSLRQWQPNDTFFALDKDGEAAGSRRSPRAACRCYPAEAHQAAMLLGLLVQVGALIWYALSPQRAAVPKLGWGSGRLPSRGTYPAMAAPRHTATLGTVAWRERPTGRQAAGWRLASIASVLLCVGLAATLFGVISRPAIAVHILELRGSAEAASTAL